MRPIEDFLDKVICGDCMDVLKELPDESIDAVITGPPYNVLGETQDWDNFDTQDFLKFTEKWLKLTFEKAKENVDVFRFAKPQRGWTGENNRFHPASKPVKLMGRLLAPITKEGSIILDPFPGPGTTALACAILDRRYIGIELNGEYCKIAEKRLETWKGQARL